MFMVHVARGKETNRYNISLLEVRLGAEGFTILHKKLKNVFVLKQWRSVYIGKRSNNYGNIAKAEAQAIKQGLENAGFDNARPLHAVGIFNRPHLEIMSFLNNAKENVNEAVN